MPIITAADERIGDILIFREISNGPVKQIFVCIKWPLFSYPSAETCVLGARKNCLIETYVSVLDDLCIQSPHKPTEEYFGRYKTVFFPSSKIHFIKGSLTLVMGKCLWFSVKIKVCQSSLSSP